MNLRFEGKRVLVTGASRGIGRALLEKMSEAGAHVIGTYLANGAAAEDFAGGLRNRGLKCDFVKMDVRDSQSVQQAVEEIETKFGPVDILVNNAGVVRDGLIFSFEDDDWREVINTNLDGSFRTIRAVARGMMRQRRGVIINLSSVAASRPGKGQANYAASKGAIESMTKALAVELSSKNIRVNAVAPGVIETDMSQDVRAAAAEEILGSVLLKRFGTVDDIAYAVMFLSSDFASYITGEVLHVDGGTKL